MGAAHDGSGQGRRTAPPAHTGASRGVAPDAGTTGRFPRVGSVPPQAARPHEVIVLRRSAAPPAWEADVTRARAAALLGWSPHAVDAAAGLAIWYAQPRAVVLELLRPSPMNRALVSAIVDVGIGTALSHLERGERLEVVLDLQRLTGFGGSERAGFAERLGAVGASLSHVHLALPSSLAPGMGASLLNTTMAFYGVPVRVSVSVSDVIARLRG